MKQCVPFGLQQATKGTHGGDVIQPQVTLPAVRACDYFSRQLPWCPELRHIFAARIPRFEIAQEIQEVDLRGPYPAKCAGSIHLRTGYYCACLLLYNRQEDLTHSSDRGCVQRAIARLVAVDDDLCARCSRHILDGTMFALVLALAL